jgi:hypothetical protein
MTYIDGVLADVVEVVFLNLGGAQEVEVRSLNRVERLKRI